MKRFRGWALCTLLAMTAAVFVGGCATAPDNVLEAGVMVEQAGEVYDENVLAVVDGYAEKLQAAYTQGLNAVYALRARDLSDPEGNISIDVQETLQRELAEQIEVNGKLVDAERVEVLDKLSLQAAVVRQFTRLLNEYNKATGVPPESIQGFIDEIATSAQTLEAAIEARGLLDQVQGETGATDWGAILRLIEERAFEAATGKLGDLDIVEILRGAGD